MLIRHCVRNEGRPDGNNYGWLVSLFGVGNLFPKLHHIAVLLVSMMSCKNK